MEFAACCAAKCLQRSREVNASLTMNQSWDNIANQDYWALSEFMSAPLPCKEAMQQVEGEHILTSSRICPVVVGLLKTLEQLKNSNLSYCKKQAPNFQDSSSRSLTPFFKS